MPAREGTHGNSSWRNRPFLRASLVLLFVVLSRCPPASAAETGGAKVPSRPKYAADGGSGSFPRPDVDLLDTPTSAVLDYQGYATTTVLSAGGVPALLLRGLQRLNIGAPQRGPPYRHDLPLGPNVQAIPLDGDGWIPSPRSGSTVRATSTTRGQVQSPPPRLLPRRDAGVFRPGAAGPPLHQHLRLRLEFDLRRHPVSLTIRTDLPHGRVGRHLGISLSLSLRPGVYVTPGFHIDFGVRGTGRAAARRRPRAAQSGPSR